MIKVKTNEKQSVLGDQGEVGDGRTEKTALVRNTQEEAPGAEAGRTNRTTENNIQCAQELS